MVVCTTAGAYNRTYISKSIDIYQNSLQMTIRVKHPESRFGFWIFPRADFYGAVFVFLTCHGPQQIIFCHFGVRDFQNVDILLYIEFHRFEH